MQQDLNDTPKYMFSRQMQNSDKVIVFILPGLCKLIKEFQRENTVEP